MKSPFKFLDSYTKEDRDIFFGREREIEELYHRAFESKIMLVYGVSGTGKSSLIHCGLANKFQETDWLPLVIRRGGNILENLAAAIKAASITPQTGEILTPLHFKKAVRSLYLDHYKPIYLIFDQFEELFIFGNKDEKRSFIQIIKAVVESEIQCRFIFVMREEYMASFTEFERYIPTIFQNRVRIEKMSHVNALEAIKGPCKVAGITLEEGFAETLLEKLSPESADVELTYLQVFLDRILKLINPIEGKVNFKISLLSQVGNISDLLGGFLDEQIALMEDPDTAMTVLKSFVSGKGTKRPASESETNDNVKSLGRDISPESVIKLIQSFVRLRVLRDKDDQGRYELRHDTLAEKIYEKFSTAEKELLEIRQYIENAYQSYQKRKILLSPDDLAYISNKDSLLNLNPELQEFLRESRKLQVAKIKIVKRLTLISAFVFVILLVILGFYVKGKMDVMNGNSYAIKSLSQTKNPGERLRLAAMAWKIHPGLLSKEALFQAFYNYQTYSEKDSVMKEFLKKYTLVFEPAPVKIEFAGCSKDNKYVFGYGDSLIFIWNIKGKLERVIKSEHYPFLDMKLSDDSQYLGVVSTDSVLSVWGIAGDKRFSTKISYNKLNTKQIFRFSKENKILVLSKAHDAVLMDNDGRILQTFDRHNGSVNAVDISSDNKFLATASSDKTINIWYFNTIKKKYDFYNKLTWHNDTVWSVSFSNRNIDVITASADSTVKIGSINNEVLGKLSLPHDWKFCYAEFTQSNRGKTLISYNYINKMLNSMTLASHGDNPTYLTYSYDDSENRLIHGIRGFSFTHFVFSPDETCFVYTQNNKAYLAENKLDFDGDRSTIYNLMELSGSGYFFSSDGRYILALEGNNFKTYFVNANEIYYPN